MQLYAVFYGSDVPSILFKNYHFPPVSLMQPEENVLKLAAAIPLPFHHKSKSSIYFVTLPLNGVILSVCTALCFHTLITNVPHAYLPFCIMVRLDWCLYTESSLVIACNDIHPDIAKYVLTYSTVKRF